MDDTLLKKSVLQKMRQNLADELAAKGIDPKSKEAARYGGLDFLSYAKSKAEKNLEELPEDEGIENIYTTTIPRRTPDSVETRRFKKQSSDEPSFVETTRGETLSDSRKGFKPAISSRDVLEASEERVTPKFKQLKDSLETKQPERSLASVSEESKETPDYFEQYQGASIPLTSFFNLPQNVQVQLNKTHKMNKKTRMMEPK